MAVNAKTGQKAWEARVADPKLQYSITGAPRIGDGLVFIGVGGAEFYTRGYPRRARREDGQAGVEVLHRAGRSLEGQRRRGVR